MVPEEVGQGWTLLLTKAWSSLIDVGYCKVESVLAFLWLDSMTGLSLESWFKTWPVIVLSPKVQPCPTSSGSEMVACVTRQLYSSTHSPDNELSYQPLTHTTKCIFLKLYIKEKVLLLGFKSGHFLADILTESSHRKSQKTFYLAI